MFYKAMHNIGLVVGWGVGAFIAAPTVIIPMAILVAMAFNSLATVSSIMAIGGAGMIATRNHPLNKYKDTWRMGAVMLIVGTILLAASPWRLEQ